MTATTTDIPHGTREGYLIERRANITACTACRNASDAYLEAHRPATVSQPGVRNDLNSSIRPPLVSTAPWVADAECSRYSRPDIFFPEDALEQQEAIAICHTCPVQRQCLETALANEGNVGRTSRHGIYGGFTPHQRAQIAKKTRRAA